MTFKRPAKISDCGIARSKKFKNTKMDVFNEKGEIVGILVNGGEDKDDSKR